MEKLRDKLKDRKNRIKKLKICLRSENLLKMQVEAIDWTQLGLINKF